MKWIHLARNRVKRLSNVDMLLQHMMQLDRWNILTSWATTSLLINSYMKSGIRKEARTV